MSTTDKQSIYLDYAAATPLDPEVAALMKPYGGRFFYNPSADYLAARKVKKDITEARQRIAHWLGCKPAEIVFTAGVTESVNLAVHGIMSQYPEGKILVGETEHEAVLEAAAQFNSQLIAVRKDGQVDINALEQQLTDDVVLISLMYANNETGVIHSLKDIAALLTQVRQDRKQRGVETQLYFHTDAAQATNYLDMHVSRLGVDLLSLSGAKIYGPKQTGALYVRGGTELKPLIVGGGQERGLRGGTENVAGIIGLAAAVDSTQSRRNEETKRVAALRNALEKELLERHRDIVSVNGSTKKRLPNITNLTISGIDGERFVQELDEKGIMAATGAACSADDDGPSHVLLAMGLSEAEAASSIRLSLGRHSTESKVQRAIAGISSLIG